MLESRLIIDRSAEQLTNYLRATVDLMKILARACGHERLVDFEQHDLTTWKRDIADLTGVRFAGPG